MDAVITKARELGKIIQEDSRYLTYSKAAMDNENDSALQEQIAQFEISRNTLNAEIQKEDKDTGIIKELDAEVKDKYNQIFASPTMTRFNDARTELQSMLAFVNQIITGSSNGQDPDTIEEQTDCAGSCGGCSGCD